jgi:hypothetical protein
MTMSAFLENRTDVVFVMRKGKSVMSEGLYILLETRK